MVYRGVSTRSLQGGVNTWFTPLHYIFRLYISDNVLTHMFQTLQRTLTTKKAGIKRKSFFLFAVLKKEREVARAISERRRKKEKKRKRKEYFPLARKKLLDKLLIVCYNRKKNSTVAPMLFKIICRESCL